VSLQYAYARETYRHAGLDDLRSSNNKEINTMKKPLFKLVNGAAVSLAFTLGQPAAALNIALTNDDGWSTYGIHALFNALTAAGHKVTLAGPLSGQSGSSAAIDVDAVLARSLIITKRADDIYSVGTLEGSAEPATSGAIASNIALQTNQASPDLLISGINDGANVGATTQISGTVGATIISIGRLIGDSIPAIAVSTDERCEEGTSADDQVVPGAGDIPDACKEVADFIVELVDELETLPHYQNGKSGLLPDGLALNINYPPGTPLGVKLADQGRIPFIAQLGGAASLEIGCYACLGLEDGDSSPGGIAGVTEITEEDVKNSDSALFAQGYITIVPIEADYTANANASKGFLGTLNKFVKKQ
jgi:5'-nucleotidase